MTEFVIHRSIERTVEADDIDEAYEVAKRFRTPRGWRWRSIGIVEEAGASERAALEKVRERER